MKFKTPSRAAGILTATMAMLVATTIFVQQLSAEKSSDGTTAELVAGLLSRFHISRPKVDDALSEKLLNRYLKQLDPQKLYFLQSDVDERSKYKHQLDNLIRVGDVTFAYETFDLYLKRLDTGIELAEKYIDAEHDFTVDEEMVVDAEDAPWAKTREEIADRWRRRIKYDLLTLKLDGTEIEEARERLHKRYKNIRRTMRQTEDVEKLEMYLSAMTHCLDPHSSYMSPRTLEDFQISMKLKLQGIGAALRSEDGYTIVASVVPGGAAAADGRLSVGDKIIGVAQEGDEEGKFVDVVEMKLSKVVDHIRGPKGTKVTLQVKTAETGEIKAYELTRQVIELKSSAVRGEIIKTGERLNGRDARIGVIHVPSFYRDFQGAQRGLEDFKSTARDMRQVLADFRDKGGVDAVVVDLRTNGGGALSEAIEVTGLFIDKGPVVQVKEQNGKIKFHDDVDEGTAYDGPLVVLCNQLSASASEIFAGAIKDYQRGIIVGDTTTHGKGTVQNVMPVSRQFFSILGGEDRGALKLTINQFYRVNGDSTQNEGVKSDIALPSVLDKMDLGESFLDNALAFDRIVPARYKPVGMVTGELVSGLRAASQQRVQGNEEFARVGKDIANYLKRKNRKTVSLNEEVMKKEREEEKANKKEEDEDKTPEDPAEGPVFPETAYNDEVLSITVDYIEQLKGLSTAGK